MKPPTVPRWLVGLFTAAEDRAFLLEDLSEQFEKRVSDEGARAARGWYWSQALSVLPWALRRDGLMWPRSWAGFAGDLRSGARTVTRSPLYAIGVCGTLALGVAAATSALAVAWNVWLAPMPYPDPERVVRIYEVEPVRTGVGSSLDALTRRQPLSATLLGDFHDHAWRTIESVSYVNLGTDAWTRDGEAQPISRATLSPQGFGILGIVPILGRLPSEPEIEGGSEALLSDRFWRTNFGADPDVLGTRMDLAQGPVTVVGVARFPPGYPGTADVMRAMGWGWTKQDDRGFRHVEVIGRIKPERSAAEATAELTAFVSALGDIHPEHRGWGAEAVVLADDIMRPYRGLLALLLAAGTTFLLLAVVNVMGLVAARRVERRTDRSIRLALGASEGRLLRGALTESLLLAVGGSLAGALVANWLIGPIRSVVPADVPRLSEVSVGPWLFAGSLAVGVAIGFGIGVCGYWASRDAGPSVGRAPVWRFVGVGGRRTIVVGQVALTTLLTACGAAIIHRVATLRAMDLGYEPESVAVTSAMLDDFDPESRWPFASAILTRLEARGISSAMAVNTPMSGDWVPQFGMKADAASDEIVYDLHLVSPNYFAVMGIALLAGRDFGPDDRSSSRPVVVVSEGFVREYFPGGTPIESVVGQIIAPLIYETAGTLVVGVVRSTRHRSPVAPVEPEIYQPLSQLAVDAMTLVVRGEPELAREAVSAVIAEVDPNVQWSALTPYESRLRSWFAPLRLQATTISVLAGLGILLASLGLYSLMAYQVATRRHELGIRRALGARDGRLMLGVVGDGMVMALLGALVGLGAWYRLLPWTEALLQTDESTGGIVPISVALVVGCACVLATLEPAIRATRVDPVAALRSD